MGGLIQQIQNSILKFCLLKCLVALVMGQGGEWSDKGHIHTKIFFSTSNLTGYPFLLFGNSGNSTHSTSEIILG